MIERKGKIVSNENGVKVIHNVYTDTLREYDKKLGAKKKAILDVYSEAQQRNIIIDAILSLGLDSTDEMKKLKEMSDFIKGV